MLAAANNLIRRWYVLLIAAALVVVPIVSGIAKANEGAMRSNFDVYTQLMISPVSLLVPIIAVMLGCMRAYDIIGNRYVSYTRTRVAVRRYISGELGAAFIVPFAAFFLLSFVGIILAFYIWPLLGNPSIDPGTYEMSSAQALKDDLTRTSFSSLLAWGPLVYGIIYSTWLGLGAATYAALGFAALVVLHNRLLALLLPFIVYFLPTIVVSLLGSPELSPMYSLMPFGLIQAPIWVAALPTLLVILLVTVIWSRLYMSMPTLPRLA